MWYWSVAILFWLMSIDHIVNVQYKRCSFAKTRLRHPSRPFDSLPYPPPVQSVDAFARSITWQPNEKRLTISQKRTHDSVRQWNIIILSFSCDVIIRMRWRAVNIMAACFRTLKENQASFFKNSTLLYVHCVAKDDFEISSAASACKVLTFFSAPSPITCLALLALFVFARLKSVKK